MSHEASGIGEVPPSLQRYAWLSLGTSIVVFGMKIVAWLITGSVGLFSDALESTVNIVAAVVAIIAIRAASRPGDAVHHYGHGKAEYLSALVEGVMIVAAAILIMITAVERLFNPRELEEVGIGLAIAVAASAINAYIAWVLIRAGKQHRSIVLEADGKHLMTDVWTTGGVVLGVGVVGLTGFDVLDPLIAIFVAINIVWAGWRLIWNSTSGLMDSALPEADHDVLIDILRRYASEEVRFHAVQTRASGRQRFVSMHVLVPGAWTVQVGHDLVENVENDIREALPLTTVQTHLEPIEDPRSWEDQPPGGLSVDI